MIELSETLIVKELRKNDANGKQFAFQIDLNLNSETDKKS